ncbi:MAG: hypothetical protein FWG31_08090 [Oscillospiraceae bacterium]|nr:hypothetical protein [Oscillospiraceae bacterium]
MVKVCPLCKKVLNEGEECTCISSRKGTASNTSSSKSVDAIIKTGASTSFFVITVFFTMSVFFTALSSGTSALGVYGAFIGNLGGAAELIEGNYLVQTILHLVSLVPSICICAGLWMIFLGFRSSNTVKTSALTFIKGAVAAQFIITITLIAFILGTVVTALSFISIEPFDLGWRIAHGQRDAVLVLIVIAIIAAAVVMIKVLFNIIGVLDMAVKSLRSGKRYGDIPAFLIAINLIIAVLNFAAAIYEVTKGNAAAAVSGICAAAFLTGMAASLSVVKRRL